MAETSVFIKFDPEKIAAIASGLEALHKRFTTSTASIQKQADSLMSDWQSDSAMLYMEKARELTTNSGEMAKILLSFSQDLASVSGIYKTGETDARHKAEALPTEGVFLV